MKYGGSTQRFVRFAAAFVMLFYGFAKINGAQFTILDSELDKPMGRVSGFWLTWYYFGYSPVYKTFLALAEIGGALLLMFQRTTLAGAFLLCAVLANVVMVDLCYGVDVGAMLIALMLLAGMVWLVAQEGETLKALFWPAAGDRSRWGAWALRLALVASTFAWTYWTANYNNRLPTPLDGAWEVVQVEPSSLADQTPRRIFFEHNRAQMVVFRANDGSYAVHDFGIDEKSKSIRMWEEWLSRKKPIFEGSYALTESELLLDGTFSASPSPGHCSMRLRRQPR
jgi:hypothetical protein